jgi:hypothetical protein
MATRNIGLLKIEVGELAGDGDLSTALASLGGTFKESCKITQDDNETFDFEIEEQDDPIESVVTKKGATTIEWAVVDFEPATLQKVWGGEVVDGKWEEPETIPEKELSVRVTPKTGSPFTYPRCKVNAKLDYEATRTGIAKIVVRARKMKPVKEGVPAFIWG